MMNRATVILVLLVSAIGIVASVLIVHVALFFITLKSYWLLSFLLTLVLWAFFYVAHIIFDKSSEEH